MVHSIRSRYSITFDDVLLSPCFSAVKPRDVVTSVKIANIDLNVPIISSAMERWSCEYNTGIHVVTKHQRKHCFPLVILGAKV